MIYQLSPDIVFPKHFVCKSITDSYYILHCQTSLKNQIILKVKEGPDRLQSQDINKGFVSAGGVHCTTYEKILLLIVSCASSMAIWIITVNLVGLDLETAQQLLDDIS